MLRLKYENTAIYRQGRQPDDAKQQSSGHIFVIGNNNSILPQLGIDSGQLDLQRYPFPLL